MRHVTIARCLRDPNLFGPHFKGASWSRWKVFLAALFGEPPGPGDLDVYRELTGRTSWPTEPLTEAAVIVGRRGGKSRTLALIAVYLACFRSYDQYLAAGEVATIGVLAVDKSQARAIFRFVLGLFQAVPMLEPMIVRRDAETIELSQPGAYRDRDSELSLDARLHLRRGSGRRGRLLALATRPSLNPDVEILRALRPGMLSIPGAVLIMASSPYAQRGELYNTFRKHFGKDDARVLVWKASTLEMNPSVDKRMIAEAYEDDPESAKAEYGAEFRTDLADFVTRETVDAVTMWGRSELPPEPGVVYFAFVDPSGGVCGRMTLAIGH